MVMLTIGPSFAFSYSKLGFEAALDLFKLIEALASIAGVVAFFFERSLDDAVVLDVALTVLAGAGAGAAVGAGAVAFWNEALA